MTRNDASKVLALLRETYPGFHADDTREQLARTVSLWAELFADDDADMVLAAVKSFIVKDTRGFAPAIGQIKAEIAKLTQPPVMTEAEAWGLVWRAVCNSGYHAQAEYDSLPPLLQRLVGSPAQLHDWALMDADEVQSVVASNFMRSYKVRAKDWQEYQALPGSIRQRLDALADGMRFPEARQIGAGLCRS